MTTKKKIIGCKTGIKHIFQYFNVGGMFQKRSIQLVRKADKSIYPLKI